MPYVIAGIVVLLVGSTLFLTLTEMKKRGVFKSKNRRLDLAIVGLTQRLRRNPNDNKAHVKRGVARYRKKDVKGAMEDLMRAIEIDDMDVEAHYHCGLIWQETGNLKRAEQEFNWIRENSEDPFYKTAVRNRLQQMRAARSR